MVAEESCGGRNHTVQSVSLPSPCCARVIAAISHNNTPKKNKNFVAVDKQLAKIQRRIKELRINKPCSSLLTGFLIDGEMHRLAERRSIP